ncbi:MAG: hypothetical protein ONB44_12440 [candidate division KSB1 bacterium]|nr:hypothetical protein [candidate division KSB1 bacterium]MDZ7302930.1 hypothetical protein [candidate division KSB1 bacterium]MDZ7312206.1 hypothetical protein [candidate division KSB1 bacterium]
MTVRYFVLLEEIRQELEVLAGVITRIETALVDFTKAKNKETGNYIVDSLALRLQSFYTGIESIFRSIAINVDGELPAGEKWHVDLLEQMGIALPEIRPHVITESTKQTLKEFLSFRHAIRNIYVFEIQSEPVIELASTTSKFFQTLKTELESFCVFLEQVGQKS